MVACEPCLAAFVRAGANGEAWALAMPPVVQACRLSRDPDKIEPVKLPVAGPGMSRESLALPRPRVSRHQLRLAGAGAAGCLVGVVLAVLLPVGVATVVSLALLVATVACARAWGTDRVPTARWLRR